MTSPPLSPPTVADGPFACVGIPSLMSEIKSSKLSTSKSQFKLRARLVARNSLALDAARCPHESNTNGEQGRVADANLHVGEDFEVRLAERVLRQEFPTTRDLPVMIHSLERFSTCPGCCYTICRHLCAIRPATPATPRIASPASIEGHAINTSRSASEGSSQVLLQALEKQIRHPERGLAAVSGLLSAIVHLTTTTQALSPNALTLKFQGHSK